MMTLEQWAAYWNVRDHPMYANLVAIVAQQLGDLAHEPNLTAPGGTSEAAVQQQLRVTAPQLGVALWRNNNGACKDDTGRQIRYGLGHDSKRLNSKWKSSDLIGIGSGGRFLAVEVKKPGWTAPKNDRERAQSAFIGTVNSMGGQAGFATSVDDLHRILKK